jgi:hypothetical protein
MGSLKDKLIANRPSNISGPRSANRFEYQKDWAICLLLKLYKEATDFLLILDYHDDVAVLDSEISPQYCSFYQIKTKDNEVWKLSDLLSKKADKSIIAKLYEHKIRFSDSAKKLTIVSNSKLEIETIDGANSKEIEELSFSRFKKTELDKVCAALKNDFSLSEIPELKDVMYFYHSDLSLTDHADHTKGKIISFLKSQNSKADPISIYVALRDEVRRKNDSEFIVNDWNDLQYKKAIGFKEFDKFINSVTIPEEYDKLMSRGFHQLQCESMNFVALKNLITRSRTLNLELNYDEYIELRQCREIVKKHISAIGKPLTDPTLMIFLKNRLAELQKILEGKKFDDEEAIMLFIIEAFYEIS